MQKLEEIAKDLISLPGNVRGEVFRTHAEYIKRKEGEGGLKRLEEKMKELGAPVYFDKTKPFDWYKEGVSSLTIITAKHIFNWTDEDVFEMGRFAPKVSFFIKVIIQYFASLERVLKEASKHWKKHFDFGSLDIVDFNEKEKLIRIQIRDFKVHPDICFFHAGYLKGVSEFAIKSKEIKVEEVKCAHRGDDCHEYLITWT